MNESIRIEVPRLPPKELNPNARVHYMVKAKATTLAQNEVVALVRDCQPIAKPFDRAIVRVAFVVPNRRPRDKGNLI